MGKFSELTKIGVALERLIFFIISFILMTHICTCIWVFLAKLNNFGPGTWVFEYGYLDHSNTELYLTSFYFTLTTITTVGFGDISANNEVEQAYLILLMLLGVISFSFATGALSSILSSLDSQDAKLKKQMTILNKMRSQYHMNPQLYDDIVQVLKYSAENNKSEQMTFIDQLPRRIRVDLVVMVHSETVRKIPMLKNCENEVLAFIAPYLKPYIYKEDEYILRKGENQAQIQFITEGIASYVLEDEGDKIYVVLEVGDRIGFSVSNLNQSMKEGVQTKFSIMCVSEFTEVLILNTDDLSIIKHNNEDVFNILMDDMDKEFKRLCWIKSKAKNNQSYTIGNGR